MKYQEGDWVRFIVKTRVPLFHCTEGKWSCEKWGIARYGTLAVVDHDPEFFCSGWIGLRQIVAYDPEEGKEYFNHPAVVEMENIEIATNLNWNGMSIR